MYKRISFIVVGCCMIALSALSQTNTNRQVLEKTAKEYRDNEEKRFKKVLALAKEKNWKVEYKNAEGRLVKLVGVDQFGLPQYLAADNLTAAATTGANKLWEGGSSGLQLSGASDNVKGKMAVWDEARVLSTHVELTGRILQKDNPSSISNHSTHVAGTLIGSGVNPLARGMSYGLKQLLAYDFDNSHMAEISAEAPNLLISNHSYGTISGWYNNTTQNRWEFYGRFGDNEDYKFGYYDSQAQMMDSIAYNAPFYLIVKSAGNNRSQNGPAVGQNYWRYNSSGVMADAGTRPSSISNNDGYDILPTYANSKNILTVGAVSGIANGYTKIDDVKMSSFSSWGPTDDGRIKPDLVSDGVNVFSASSSGDNAYASLNGTSMASPTVAGSLLLLQDYYAQLNGGKFMRAATLKGLAIHTTDEAGDAPGPDYKHGWGLINVARAAEYIKAKNTGNYRIFENVLTSGQTFSTTVIASGKGPLSATISWTDPKGAVDFTTVMNNPAPKLINDLDIRITANGTEYKPWILNPANPSWPATTGDNFRDNVERIDIENTIPGVSYTITITHKGTLERGSQAYSLIIGGVGSQAYCTSSAQNNAGSRIDSVSFAGIKKASVAGCNSFTNNTAIAATVEPNQSYPLAVYLNSCDASTASKIVKVFIDLDNNGSFNDAGELLATSNVIIGAGVFTTTIKIPGTIGIGNTSILRIVAQDAIAPELVNACGNYSNGETQDFTIKFVGAQNDMAAVSFINLQGPNCGNTEQLITVNIRNNGTVAKTAVPIAAEIKNGTTTIASGISTLTAYLGAYDYFQYTLPFTFNAQTGQTYTVKVIVNESLDQVRSNDTLTGSFTVAAAVATPSASGAICAANANLSVINPVASNNYFWYTSNTTSAPVIGRGSAFVTTNIPVNKTYYLGSGMNGKAGLSSKALYAGGGGYLASTGNYVKYSSTVPLVLESARMYSKYGGKVEISVIELTSETSSGYSYKSIGTSTVYIPTTSPVSTPGSVTGYDAADTGALVNINLPLPAGQYAIRVVTDAQTNLFRNNNVSGSPYPFDIPGVISFYSNSAAPGNTDPNYFQGFYYFLYDMRLKTSDCVSPRTTIVAKQSVVPVATLINDTLVSNIAIGNQWNLNGNPISGATGNKFKPTQTGDYSVTVLDSTACVQTSSVVNFTITAVNPVVNASVDLSLSPNPSKGLFTLSMNLARRDDLFVNIVNAQGQTVYVKSFAKVQGKFVEQINLLQHAAGVYMIKLQHGSNVYYSKLLVQR